MDPSIISDVPRQDHMGMDYIPVYADAAGGRDPPGVVRINPVVMQNMNLRLAAVDRGDLPRQVDTVGFVDYDERRLAHVHLRTDGWIENLSVRATGERVAQDQVLFLLYSPTLISAQEEFLQTIRRGESLIPAARQRLQSLGIDPDTIREVERNSRPLQQVPIKARQGGVVKALNVAEGMYVTPATEIMTIADLSRVWVIADLFEHQIDALAVGREAEVALPFRPGEMLRGIVDFIHPALATRTRTVRVRLTFPNPEERLKPGMYADVRLVAEPLRDIIHVPAEAVIRTGRHERVIVAFGEGRFEGREVKLGRRAGERFEILEGLMEGERIVASGHFLIDSETAVGADLERMVAADPLEEPEREIWSEGEIRVVDVPARRINLFHVPIPELNWPAITMDFTVAEDVDLRAVEPGMAVRFRVREQGSLGYEITAIKPAAGERHD